MADKQERQAEEIIDTEKKEVADSQKDKKGNRQQRRRSQKDKGKDKPRGKRGAILNNPIYYNSYSNYSQEAGKLAFGVPLGAILSDDYNDAINMAIPGVMTIAFIPTPGVSNDFTSPMNRSSIHYWTQLRSIQKASAPYDHQDVTMMLIAMDSCYMFHRLMKKAYGLMRNFTPLNRYYPRAILAGMGFNFNDLLNNIDDFRAYINQFAYNCGQYALPKDVWFFDRHEELTSTIIVDSDTTRAQTYQFVPAGFWQYDNTVASGSQLIWKTWLGDNPQAPTLHTFEEIVAFGNALINAVSNEQDFSYISGDMMQLYGSANCHSLPYTMEGEIVNPVYSEEIMSQVENMMIAGEWATGYTPVISQNPEVNSGAIIFQPQFKAMETVEESWSAWTRHYMNMHMEHPTSDDVLVASRLMYNQSMPALGTVSVTSCGSEIVQFVQIWEVNPSTGAFREIYVDSNALVSDFGTESSASIQGDIQKAARLTQFDWHPMIRWYAGPNSATPNVFLGWVGDIDNITPVPDQNLFRMHEAAMFSLFDVRSATNSSRVNYTPNKWSDK